MKKLLGSLAVSAACTCAFSGAALADEEMDKIINLAMPHMHHSCESVIDIYSDDDAKVADIVRLMAMVSLYNRQIDVVKTIPDEADQARLADEFTEELEDACDDDPGMLLAGAVDIAIRETIDAFE
ncbi:YmgD family protein [Shimia sediminis]|uniref:YmgD family protein n=1 Tax=Shimia sediminis TaxID=2497945 RepID=UPI000F8F7366|nr:YmgD family protein [Shimia sediminis]